MMDPSADGSLAERQERIVEEMNALGDWMAKYEYLVDLGRSLESPEGIRAEEHRVPGCQAKVWITAETEDGRLRLAADSNALITRGLVALLLRVLDGQPAGEIAAAELTFLDRTDLGAHLSPSRANGLAAMVKRIRSYAEEGLGAEGG